jgi:hypothetical protein
MCCFEGVGGAQSAFCKHDWQLTMTIVHDMFALNVALGAYTVVSLRCLHSIVVLMVFMLCVLSVCFVCCLFRRLWGPAMWAQQLAQLVAVPTAQQACSADSSSKRRGWVRTAAPPKATRVQEGCWGSTPHQCPLCSEQHLQACQECSGLCWGLAQLLPSWLVVARAAWEAWGRLVGCCCRALVTGVGWGWEVLAARVT